MVKTVKLYILLDLVVVLRLLQELVRGWVKDYCMFYVERTRRYVQMSIIY